MTVAIALDKSNDANPAVAASPEETMYSPASIRLPMTDWIPIEGDLDAWRNAAGDVLSTHYFPQAPDLPVPLSDLDGIRRAYRQLLDKRGALVELEPAQIQGCAALYAIFELVQTGNRVMYMAVLMIPFRDHNFMAKVTCPEVGAVLHNGAENAEGDRSLRDHALSRARAHVQLTLLQAELPASLRHLPPFEGSSCQVRGV